MSNGLSWIITAARDCFTFPTNFTPKGKGLKIYETTDFKDKISTFSGLSRYIRFGSI